MALIQGASARGLPCGLSPLGERQRRQRATSSNRNLVPRASSTSSTSSSSPKDAIKLFVPAVCLAWLGIPVLGARGGPVQPTAQAPSSVSVLDKLAMRKGGHDELYGELMDYYLSTNHPHRNRGMDASGRGKAAKKAEVGIQGNKRGNTRATPTADVKKTVFHEKEQALKIEPMAPAEKVSKLAPTPKVTSPNVAERKAAKGTSNARKSVVDQNNHLKLDKDVFKVEMGSALAVGLVCAAAFLYLRFRANPLADEAWGGIDKDFIPIREVDTGETEEQKEFARMEAAKAIARAKKKEKEFAERRSADGEVPVVPPVPVQEQIMQQQRFFKAEEMPQYDVDPETGSLPSEEAGATESGKPSSPGLVAIAMLSVMADDIKKELKNLPKSGLPESRTMVCTKVKGAGKSMVVRTPRVKLHPSKRQISNSGAQDGKSKQKSKTIHGKDLLLAPFAPALKEISGKRVAPLISDKYNPMAELHDYVNKPEGDVPREPKSERDPFIALLTALQAWDGPKAPESLKKYDPASNIDQIEICDVMETTDANTYPDPLITFIKAAKAFDGPKASDELTKFDPLGQLEKIHVSSPEDGKEYSLLQAMLRAAPEQAKGPDHSIIKALLNAEVDVSPARYDVWKAAMDVKFPEVDVEKFFPVIGDIMTRLRENAQEQISGIKGVRVGKGVNSAHGLVPMEADVADAERRADEAEKKALALLERIERKEDELLNKLQQLKTDLADTDGTL